MKLSITVLSGERRKSFVSVKTGSIAYGTQILYYRYVFTKKKINWIFTPAESSGGHSITG